MLRTWQSTRCLRPTGEGYDMSIGGKRRRVRIEKRGTLTVCMGLPASGKSTWVREHAKGALVVCADSIRTRGVSAQAMFGKMRRETYVALAEGKDVVVDACSLRMRDREPWLAIARRLRVTTRLVVFDTDVDVCRLRDRVRARPAGRLGVYAARMVDSLREVEREEWGSVVRVPGETKTGV